MRARLAAHSMHAQGKTNTSAARSSFMSRFEREVDPNRKLPAAERAKRAESARKAYFTSLAYQSAKRRSPQQGACPVPDLS
jgi:hypothetical protein